MVCFSVGGICVGKRTEPNNSEKIVTHMMMSNQTQKSILGRLFSLETSRKIGGMTLICSLMFFWEGQTRSPRAGETAKAPVKSSFSKAKSLKNEPKVIYRFSEHLADAQTEIYVPEKEERKQGKWDGRQLVFEKLSPLFAIQKIVQTFNKELKQAISLKTVPDAVRILCFHNVPPGTTLIVYSGIPDMSNVSAETAPPSSATIYLTVWAGAHRLARLPISTTSEWSSVQLDLGVISLLMRNIIMTFEITVDDRITRSFAFDAEILN